MNAVGERNAGKPLVAFDEGALCNDRVLLYCAVNLFKFHWNFMSEIRRGKSPVML